MADEEHCMPYEFQLGIKANETLKDICSALGQNAIGNRKCGP